MLILSLATACAGSSRARVEPLADAGPGDASVACSSAYPTSTAIRPGQALPDLSFATEAGVVRLSSYHRPCAARAELLVIRASAGWCGTCRWHAAHTGELRALGVAVLDLLVADDDNLPAEVRDLAAWRARIDAPGELAVDARYTLGALDPIRGALPLVVLVERRTMTVVGVMSDPDPDQLVWRVKNALAQADGVPGPASPTEPLRDGHFTRSQWDLLHAMTVPGAPPPDPTNAKADDEGAATLGRALFDDAALSPGGAVSCATCHVAARGFSDGEPQSTGVGRTDRHSPRILLAAHARWQFWDGRADTQWMQALGPLEDPKEFGSSRLFVAHGVRVRHGARYEAIFGPLPPLADAARFPASGKPGDPAWEAMSAADRAAVTRVFTNVGKAIAAFERTLRMKPGRFDAYVAGDTSALIDTEKRGLAEFFASGCAQCHWGPRLTDDAFHVVRFPTGRADGAADRGRIDAFAKLAASELNALGPFSDAPAAGERLRRVDPGSPPPNMLGAFKTPTLRGVAADRNFGHGGALATLEAVAAHYARQGLPPGDPRATGSMEPWLPRFADAHRDGLIPFLRVLTAE